MKVSLPLAATTALLLWASCGRAPLEPAEDDAGVLVGGAGSGGANVDAAKDVPVSLTVDAYCRQLWALICDKVFACFSVEQRNAFFGSDFGSTLLDCKGAKVDMACSAPRTQCPTYVETKGAACLQELRPWACAEVSSSFVPESCNEACPLP
jgi:hypothetical protein